MTDFLTFKDKFDSLLDDVKLLFNKINPSYKTNKLVIYLGIDLSIEILRPRKKVKVFFNTIRELDFIKIIFVLCRMHCQTP